MLSDRILQQCSCIVWIRETPNVIISERLCPDTARDPGSGQQRQSVSPAPEFDRIAARWKPLTPCRTPPAPWRRSRRRSIPSSIGIVVCIPCFRRPQHLRQTLESLASQRTGRRFAVVMVENDALRSESVPVATEFLASDKLHGSLRGRAAAGQLPRDQCRVRDGAGDIPGGGQLPDDRRRRNRLAGLAGADDIRRPRPPAPISSAGRSGPTSTTRESAGCAVIRPSRRPTPRQDRCR